MSDTNEALLLQVNPAQTPVQGNLEISTDQTAFLHPWQRQSEVDPIRLETTGVTAQSEQLELLEKVLVVKDSIVSKLLSIGGYDLAEPLDKCHTVESFAQCQGCRKVRHFWNRCENFYCPVCQPALARERTEGLKFWSELIPQPKHVVLTVRNTRVLSWTYVKWFKACLAKLRRRKFARNWRSGLWSLEVTNEGRGWHLHAHLLIDANYIDKSELARQWADIVGQDFAIVGVKDARDKSYLKECCKYTVKGSQLASWQPLDIAAFIYAFSGQRTFGVFGDLYGRRSEWASELKRLTAEKRRCECGCDQWKIYSEDEWSWQLLTQGGPTLQPIPPPKSQHPCQVSFWSEHQQPR
jgi:hypothetical protein